jgi:parallel beta-helix repeat protein
MNLQRTSTNRISLLTAIILVFALTLGLCISAFAGLNLEVPLEMVDLGLATERQRGSQAATSDFTRSSIYLDPDNYDGATYYFEVVAKNTDSANRTVCLKCTNNNTIYAQILVEAGTAEYTRKRVLWNPASPAVGKNAYLVTLDKTSADGDLIVQTARIVVQQTDATKTRIQIPLVQSGHDESAAPGGYVDGVTSTIYAQGDERNYSLWQKETSKYGELRGSSPWTLEAVLGNSWFFGTTSAALHTSSGTLIPGTEISNTGVVSRLVDVSFSDSTIHFTNGESFEIRIKNAGPRQAQLASGARLYVSLTDLNRAEVLYRVGRRTEGTIPSQMVEQRILFDAGLFSSPRAYFEASGFCDDDAESVFLQDDGTNDSGAGGLPVPGSGINFNVGAKRSVRTSLISPTNGHRFYAATSALTDSLSLNHVWLVVTAGNNVPVLDWTNNAGFVGDGVHSETGQSGATFEFQVQYTDLENNAPMVSQVWVDLNDNAVYGDDEKFDMTKMSGEGDDYTAGVNYNYAMAISYVGDGTLNYRFYFNDGKDAVGVPATDHPLTVINVPPTLAWTGNPGFESDGVEPDSAESGSSFDFEVKYTDADGDAPTASQVWIDLNDSGNFQAEEKFNMTSLGGTEYKTGVNYTQSVNILYSGDGTLSYRFYFSDGKDDATGPPATRHPLMITNEIPVLDWTGEEGFSDGVKYSDGGISGSSFEFRVKYSDGDGDAPTVSRAWIDLDDSGDYQAGEKFDMTGTGGSDYLSGVTYRYTRPIDFAGDGTLNYRFDFSDGKHDATGDPAADHTLTVEPSGIQTLITLASRNLGPGQTTTVVVGPGTYEETVTMHNGINVVAAVGTRPVIKGAEAGAAAVVFSGEMSCNLKGFDISKNDSGAGVFVNGSGAGITGTIEDCIIHDNQSGPGVRLNGKVVATIKGCSIYKNEQEGIATSESDGDQLASGSNITIKGNTIGAQGNRNKAAGVYLIGTQGGNVQVTIGGSDPSDSNAISQNAEGGIVLRSIDQAIVQNNNIFNNTRPGLLLVDVNTVSPHIRNNDIHDHNKEAGINIGGASNAVIRNNDIHDNYSGIAFYVATNPDITGNASSKPITIRGNNIRKNSYAGIAVRDPISGLVTITLNNIHQNNKGGIGIENACNLEITSNDIYDNVRGGIHTGRDTGNSAGFSGAIGSAVLTIRQNKVHNNGGSNYGGGMDVRHASGIIQNNLIYENRRGGIRFNNYFTEIVNNTVIKNGPSSFGGGIIFDGLTGAINDPPEGTLSGETLIRNNICAYNARAGIRVGADSGDCPENELYSGDDILYRDHNLLYANYPWDDVHGRANQPDCGWPDHLIMSCVNEQYGGCGADWEYNPTRIVMKSPNDIMADPLFKDMANDDYTLSSGSPGKGAGDDHTDMGAYGGAYPIDW